MELSSDSMHEVLYKLLYKPEEITNGEPPEGAVQVQGIARTFCFHPGRLEEQRANIQALLDDLPLEFAGGMTFMNMVINRRQELWGNQMAAEALACMGMAIGKVQECLPRQLWTALPGGVPYYYVEFTKPDADQSQKRSEGSDVLGVSGN